jgi:hypothetical protein
MGRTAGREADAWATRRRETNERPIFSGRPGIFLQHPPAESNFLSLQGLQLSRSFNAASAARRILWMRGWRTATAFRGLQKACESAVEGRLKACC